MKYFNSESCSAQKQHLGISQYACHVLEEDRIYFSTEGHSFSWNRFLNQLFHNFMEMELYPANLNTLFQKMNSDYMEELKKVPRLNEQQKNKLINAFAHTFIKNYQPEKMLQMESKCYKVFTLNRENAERLAGLDGSIESQIFRRPGKFLSIIVETYVKKPFIERERIIFYENIHKIEWAIQNGRIISFNSSNGNMYRVIPFKIASDIMGSYLYLAGKVVQTSDPKQEGCEVPYYASFRVSIVRNAHVINGQSDVLSYVEKEELEGVILQKGIQYLLVPYISATVKFSERGWELYQQMLFQRPNYVKKMSKDTYQFEAPYAQLKHYFINMLEAVEILEPDELREDLHKVFRNAANVYE